MSDINPFSPEKKPNSAEEQSLWNRLLPRKYLKGEVMWNDDDFMPKDAKKEYIDVFRASYVLYFRQICESDVSASPLSLLHQICESDVILLLY